MSNGNGINMNCINIPLDKFFEYLLELHYYNEFQDVLN
jgi:hypothetical protein